METISKQTILEMLQALKSEVVTTYKVKSLELFGSVARGEQKIGSDIDLLVEFADDADMFDLVGLNIFFEEKFHCKVDVVSKGALRQELQRAVAAEAIAV